MSSLYAVNNSDLPSIKHFVINYLERLGFLYIASLQEDHLFSKLIVQCLISGIVLFLIAGDTCQAKSSKQGRQKGFTIKRCIARCKERCVGLSSYTPFCWLGSCAVCLLNCPSLCRRRSNNFKEHGNNQPFTVSALGSNMIAEGSNGEVQGSIGKVQGVTTLGQSNNTGQEPNVKKESNSKEEAIQKAEEERKKRQEEAQRKKEQAAERKEAAKRKAAEARQKQLEAKKKRQEEGQRKKKEAAKRRKEAKERRQKKIEAKRKKQEEARKRKEEAAKRKAEARRKAKEKRQRKLEAN
ncbi:stress response protein nst1 [Plakobranchus ocellatus]|uniref:Stress response protein nst1 n=1 Tax=Plakobranchus ocellatus TaxID=259542 RepID=A0AAV4ACF7_9GAST|nr:stress response protein nst1 [Plakobranchus ocellatus]